MTFHISAKPGEIAETVLLPGDPLRAKWAAETYLQDAVCVNQTRGMLGFTGTWRGNRVTIQGSGMGMPSLSIYVNELIRDYGAQTLIRIGSCGGMQPEVGIRDVILAMTASTASTPSRTIFKELNFAPCADFGLLQAAWTAAQGRVVKTHVGGIYSSDTFYDERPGPERPDAAARDFGGRDGGRRAVYPCRPLSAPRFGGADRQRPPADPRSSASRRPRAQFWRYGRDRVDGGV